MTVRRKALVVRRICLSAAAILLLIAVAARDTAPGWAVLVVLYYAAVFAFYGPFVVWSSR